MTPSRTLKKKYYLAETRAGAFQTGRFMERSAEKKNLLAPFFPVFVYEKVTIDTECQRSLL